MNTRIFPVLGVYVYTYGKVSKNIVLQYWELPMSVACIGKVHLPVSLQHLSNDITSPKYFYFTS